MAYDEDISDDDLRIMYEDDINGDMQFSTGHLASAVNDLCEERLTKADFVRLAKAIANILLVASGCDDPLIDVRDDDFAAESAATIQQIWLGTRATSKDRIG
jgi:hypothetical protein